MKNVEIQVLPPPTLTVFAAVVGVIFGVRFSGLLQAFVDLRALNKPADEVAGQTVAITDTNVSARAHTAATDCLADAIKELTTRVDDLRTELIRSAAKLK